jgi:hypothetical protein
VPVRERLAAEEGADLIVVSRNNKGSIKKALVGSVTASLLERPAENLNRGIPAVPDL